MLKVLISSHAYVVAINQQKLELLGSLSEVSLSLLVPESWKAALRETNLEKSTDPNYEIHSLPIFFNGNNDRFFYPIFSLLKLFSKLKPDLVHIEEEPWSFACLQLNLFAKVFGAKTIFFTWENLYREHRPWYSLVEKINLSFSHAAVAGNTQAKEILEKRGFKKEILVLPQLGVNQQTFQKKKESVLANQLGLKDFVIGYFGRLEEQKGLRDLIAVFKKLKFPAQLLIIGSGPLKEWLKKEAEINKRIIYPGVINHSEIPAYFNLLDVFVLPSRTTSVWKEQFGHVLIEAMASGVPVLGSSSGAIPEVIGGAGLIFQEGDVEDLAQKITLLSQNKSLIESLSQKGLDRVKDFYTQEKIAQKTFKFYQTIAKVRP